MDKFRIFNNKNFKTTDNLDNYIFKIERYKEIRIMKGFNLPNPGPNPPCTQLSEFLNNENVLQFLNSENEIIKNYTPIKQDRITIQSLISRDYLSFKYDGKSWQIGGLINNDYWTPGTEIRIYDELFSGFIIKNFE